MTFGLQKKKPDQFVWLLDCVCSSLKGIKRHFVGWKCRNTPYIQKSDQCHGAMRAAAPNYLLKHWNSFIKFINFSMHLLIDGRVKKKSVAFYELRTSPFLDFQLQMNHSASKRKRKREWDSQNLLLMGTEIACHREWNWTIKNMLNNCKHQNSWQKIQCQVCMKGFFPKVFVFAFIHL